MKLFRRPWHGDGPPAEEARPGPADCLLVEAASPRTRHGDHAVLMARSEARGARELWLLPYPPRGRADRPLRIRGLPARLPTGHEPRNDDERRAAAALARMHRVLARVDELGAALDDPGNLWPRLRKAWDRATDEQDPRMAEIVRQARDLPPHLAELRTGLRRILRRYRERVPLDRVQEIDRAAMLWLVRQPGRTVAERAGADQRILAIARHESLDTLENRVLHAYLRLAVRFARQWLAEHAGARHSERYRRVDSWRRTCGGFARELAALGVGIAEPDVPANYALLELRAYREIRSAWIRLLRQDKAEDDLWAWQAQTWTDFCALAVALALHDLADARLIAQAPILWHEEAHQGRRFSADRPLAVFWLRDGGLIVEVQLRPVGVSQLQFETRAALWLRIAALDSAAIQRRVPVWTPHCFAPLDLAQEARKAVERMNELRRLAQTELMRRGLILVPAQEAFAHHRANLGDCRVDAVALGAEGAALASGLRAIAAFVRESMGGG